MRPASFQAGQLGKLGWGPQPAAVGLKISADDADSLCHYIISVLLFSDTREDYNLGVSRRHLHIHRLELGRAS